MCKDLLRIRWGNVELNGRSGQEQKGVDLFARIDGEWFGAQCKNTENLTIAVVREEVGKATAFEPPLTEFVMLTTASRDARLQEHLRTQLDPIPFRLTVLFWEDLELLLCDDEHTLRKYFGILRHTAASSSPPAAAAELFSHSGDDIEVRHVAVVCLVVQRPVGVVDDAWAECADRHLDEADRALRGRGGITLVRGADEITVCFGIPVARDRQAHQAVDAALSLGSRGSSGTGGDSLSFTVGIVSGRMLFSPAQQRPYPSRLPLLAETIAREAPARAVVVSQGVFDELRGDYVVEPIPPTLRTWRVIRREDLDDERAPPRPRSRLTPFVGREAELRTLKDAWAQTLARTGTFFVIRGEIGMGKSRLMRELRDHARASGGRVLTGTCFEQHQLSPFYPGANLAMKSFDIAPNDSVLDRRRKLETNLQKLSVDVNRDVAIFADLLAFNSSQPYAPLDFAPAAKRELVLECFVRLFRALASIQPTLVIIEDAHWSDPSTLEFVRRLTANPVRNLMVVATCRPRLLTDLGGTHLQLDKMRPRELSRMLAHIVRERRLDLSDEAARQIIKRASGNPLFLEELLRSASATTGSEEELPDNVLQLLQTRIVNREPAALRVVQAAAALGTRFSIALLAQSTGMAIDELGPFLERLEHEELLVRRGSDEAEFLHVLLREAAYRTLPDQHRPRLHERIRCALIRAEHSAFVERYPEELGRHSRLAERFTDAARAYARAARRAAKRPAYDEAMRFIDAGLEVATKGETKEHRSCELELRVLRGVVLASRNGYAHPEVAKTYRLAVKLVDKTEDSDRPPLFHALRGLWAYFALRADLTRARTISRHLRRLTDDAAAEEPAPDMELESLRTMGTVDYYEGRFSRAYQSLSQVEKVYSVTQSTRYTELYGQDPLVVALSYSALSSVIMGELDRGRTEADRAILLARQIQHPFTLAMCLVFVCIAFQLRGDEERARELALEAISLAKERGFALWRAMASMVEGWASAALDHNVTQGVARIRSGLDAHRMTGGLLGVPYFRYLELHRSLALEVQATPLLLQACEVALQEALESARSTGEHWMSAELHRLAGRLAEVRAELDTAERCYCNAARFADRQQARLFELRARLDQARVWLRLHRSQADAIALVDGVVRRFEPGLDAQDLRDARAWLDAQRLAGTTGGAP